MPEQARSIELGAGDFALGELVFENPALAERPPAGRSAAVERAVRLMRERASGSLDPAEAAAAARLSASRFAEPFKAETGQSPMAYFTGLRMERAARALAEEGASVAGARSRRAATRRA